MFFLSLYFCLFWFVFNFTSSLMGGIYMIGELGGSSSISFYSTVFFGLGNACTFALGERLGKKWGKITVLKTCLLLFILILSLCPLSPTFFLLNFFHFIAGFVSGPIFPIAYGLIMNLTQEKNKEITLASIAFLTTVTPVTGACFGGWIAYDYHWKQIFYLQLPFMAATLFFLHQKKEKEEREQVPPFDSTGYTAYLLSIISWTTFITLGQELDWFRSNFLCFLFFFAFTVSVFFILWELQKTNPFMDLRLLKIPSFSLSLFCVGFLFSAFFGMVVLLTLWLHLDANYTPLWISLLMLHMVIAGAALFVFMIKWIKKMPYLIPVILATTFFAISCFYATVFNVDINFARLSIARILAGFGLAFFLFPLLLFALKSLPSEKHSEGIGIFHSLRLLAGSLGLAIYPTIWDRRKVFYHERLGSYLTSYSENTQDFLAYLSFFSHSKSQTNALLEEGLQQQATALALADVFYLMGWIMTGLLILLVGYFMVFKLKKA